MDKEKDDYIIPCLSWFGFRVKLMITPGKMYELRLSQVDGDRPGKTGTFFQRIHNLCLFFLTISYIISYL